LKGQKYFYGHFHSSLALYQPLNSDPWSATTLVTLVVVFSICKISKIANLIVTKRSSINVTLYFGNKLNSQCQIYVLLTWDSPSCLSWSIIEFWNMGMKNKFVVYMGMWGLPPFIFWMNLFSSALGISEICNARYIFQVLLTCTGDKSYCYQCT